MIQTAQTLTHQLTKIDTLQDQVNHLRHVVDSLNTVSATTTIGTGYFHDIIGGVIAIFIGFLAIIVGLGGFISWKSITDRFQHERERMQNNFDERINTLETQFNIVVTQLKDQAINNTNKYDQAVDELKKESKEIRKTSIIADVNISRAMSGINQQRENWLNAFAWALKTIPGYVELNDLNMVYQWIDRSEFFLSKIDFEKAENVFQLNNMFEVLKSQFDEILQVIPEDLTTTVTQMLEKITSLTVIKSDMTD